MTRLTVDSTLPEKLLDVKELVELCDSSGDLIGFFHPFSRIPPEALKPTVSDEELDRREEETETYSTAEVKTYLASL